jgi:hypothetical protein
VIVVEENLRDSSRGRRLSVCTPLTSVCERGGLGSSLVAGEGKIVVDVL